MNDENMIFEISIHALLAESDFLSTLPGKAVTTFLSTLSLRRATQSSAKSTPEEVYFYPRSPCGERLNIGSIRQGTASISIHALLAESDAVNLHPETRKSHFYPRSPCGERLKLVKTNTGEHLISIHALLAESDFAVGC